MTHSDTAPHEACLHEADLAIVKDAIVDIRESLKSITELLTAHAVLDNRVSVIKEDVHNINLRLSALELAVARQHGTNRWMERVVWALVSSALMALLALKLTN